MQVDQNAAQIYAKAVFNLAKERGALDEFAPEADQLREFLDTKAGGRLQRFWESPAILTENKLAMVDKVFGKETTALTRNLVRMLLNKLRVENLPLILKEIQRLVNEERGLKPGRVVTAVELGDDRKKKLQEALEKRVGQKLALEYEVKPAIIGGVIFQYEDKLFDDSLHSRLAELRSRLKRAASGKKTSGAAA